MFSTKKNLSILFFMFFSWYFFFSNYLEGKGTERTNSVSWNIFYLEKTLQETSYAYRLKADGIKEVAASNEIPYNQYILEFSAPSMGIEAGKSLAIKILHYIASKMMVLMESKGLKISPYEIGIEIHPYSKTFPDEMALAIAKDGWLIFYIRNPYTGKLEEDSSISYEDLGF